MQFSIKDLSICIPFYRAENIPFLKNLINQLQTEFSEVKIIVADNGSPDVSIIVDSFKNNNVQFLLHPQNIGRAANRNSFLTLVKTPLILFLDADSLPVSQIFISNYLSQATPNHVICGGTAYQNIFKPDEILRWTFGSNREVIDLEQRKKNPYASFMTNNFLIPTEIFKKYHFDERLKEYGHEDSLFGLLLEQKQIPILHIENRVYHTGLESAEVFLQKTKKGIENLVKISKWETDKPDLNRISKLWKIYHKLEKWKISTLLKLISPVFIPMLEKNLLGKKPRMLYFDLYKLMYLAQMK